MLKRFCVGIFIFTLLLGSAIQAVPNDISKFLTSTIILSPDQEIPVKGLRGAYSFYFYVPKSVKNIQNANLTFDFYFTDTLLKNLSNLTFVLNEVPLKTLTLAQFFGREGRVTLPIKGEIIKSGANYLRVEFFAQANEDLCKDLDSPSNWYVVKKTSKLEIFYQPFKAKLDYFPEPLVRMNQFKTKDLMFYYQNLDSQTLEMAANFSRQLGHWDKDIYPGMIQSVLKLPKDWSKKFHLLQMSPTFNIEAGQVQYQFVQPKIDANGIVLQIKSDKLETARNALTNQFHPDFLFKLKDQTAQFVPIFKKVINYDLLAFFSNQLSFKEAGYEDVINRGSFNGTTTFYFAVPAAWELLDGAAINFKFSLSPLLDSTKSQVTVFINGIYAGTTKLKTVPGRKMNFKVKIPPQARDRQLLEVAVRYYLDTEQQVNLDCGRRDYDKAWFIIHGDSWLDYKHRDKNVFYLSDLPGPYLLRKKVNLPLFVMPDQPTAADLTALERLSMSMGQLMPKNENWFSVKKASQITKEDLKTNHLIVIGLAERQKLFSQMNTKLPISFRLDDSKPFIHSSQIGLPYDFRDQMGTVQLIPSPFNFLKTIVVVTGTNDELMLKALDTIINRNQLAILEANVVVVNESGKINTIASYDKSQIQTDRQRSLQIKLQILLVLFVVFTIFAVIAMSVLYALKRKN